MIIVIVSVRITSPCYITHDDRYDGGKRKYSRGQQEEIIPFSGGSPPRFSLLSFPIMKFFDVK